MLGIIKMKARTSSLKKANSKRDELLANRGNFMRKVLDGDLL